MTTNQKTKRPSLRRSGKILRESVFVLPVTAPNGDNMLDVHADLEHTLLKEFGGFRVTPSEDVFFDNITDELVHDDTLTYTILIPDSLLYTNKVKTIAQKTAYQLDQDFVYFKHPNGEVYLLDIA